MPGLLICLSAGFLIGVPVGMWIWRWVRGDEQTG